MGSGVTHKAQVVRRWLRHQSPLKIARDLSHSQDAVDRYIADFQKVRLLAQKLPAADLPALTGLSKHLVKQYLALLREYEPQLALYTESTDIDSADSEANTGKTSVEQQKTTTGVLDWQPALAFPLGSAILLEDSKESKS